MSNDNIKFDSNGNHIIDGVKIDAETDKQIWDAVASDVPEELDRELMQKINSANT